MGEILTLAGEGGQAEVVGQAGEVVLQKLEPGEEGALQLQAEQLGQPGLVSVPPQPPQPSFSLPLPQLSFWRRPPGPSF